MEVCLELSQHSDAGIDMGSGSKRLIPSWLKVAYTLFVAVLAPYYWKAYSPWNFLYFCDVALLFTLVGMSRSG
jgi:hypothetical protein